MKNRQHNSMLWMNVATTASSLEFCLSRATSTQLQRYTIDIRSIAKRFQVFLFYFFLYSSVWPAHVACGVENFREYRFDDWLRKFFCHCKWTLWTAGDRDLFLHYTIYFLSVLLLVLFFSLRLTIAAERIYENCILLNKTIWTKRNCCTF